MRRAAIRQVVAIHAGEHDVGELHQCHALGHVGRLVGIEPAARIAGIHRTEAAGARAHRAHQHDGGGAGIPAFADVRALGFLAHGGELVRVHVAARCARSARRRRQCLQPARLAARAAAPAAASARGFWPSRMAVKPCAVVYFSPLRAPVAKGAAGSTTTWMPLSSAHAAHPRMLREFSVELRQPFGRADVQPAARVAAGRPAGPHRGPVQPGQQREPARGRAAASNSGRSSAMPE